MSDQENDVVTATIKHSVVATKNSGERQTKTNQPPATKN